MKIAAIGLLLASAMAASAEQGPLMQAVTARYNAVKQNLIETAEVMPEKDYSFKLNPTQRPFGEWIDHTVGSLYNFCSAAKGEAAPKGKTGGEKTKGELVANFKEAFAYCDATLAAITDQKALTEMTVNGKPAYPVGPLLSMIGSLNEHYGNLVGYMRARGITPPSTARTLKK